MDISTQDRARDELTLEQARAVLAAQPFARHVGTEITEFGGGVATLVVGLRPEHAQQFGFVHGGVLAYLADNALTFAAGSALGPNVLTGGFSITYLRPAQGARLRARAAVTDATRRQAVTRCEIYCDTDDSSTLCALAQGTVRTVDRTVRGNRLSPVRDRTPGRPGPEHRP
ncbi:PaaI family thioesterase [Nocardia spumae]|uniref:PaaI family thioesterase n=1 Tax=Nocardia spumae TaxID=2887190 RepID=UPI001D154CCC|nr:PaaI family thioesterase [Nocardia spumae]